jgi:chloramphenicol 3-O phosphotransferase
MSHPKPSIIFLNGTSSSGKSTLTAALQSRLEPVFLHFSEDYFFNMLPGNAHERSDFMTVGSALYTGFARSAAAMVAVGNSLIIDTVAWDPGSMARFERALRGVDVLSVGVHCDIDVLEERERQRGDRSSGLARTQFPKVHVEALYDVEVDTSTNSSDECADTIVRAWLEPRAEPAFVRLRKFAVPA